MKYLMVFLFSSIASFIFVYRYIRRKYINKHIRFQEEVHAYIGILKSAEDSIDKTGDLPEDLLVIVNGEEQKLHRKTSDLRKALIIAGLTLLETEENEGIDTDFISDYDEFIKRFTHLKQIALQNNEKIVDKEQLIQEFWLGQS